VGGAILTIFGQAQAMEITTAVDLTLNEAQTLYGKFAGKDGDEAARAMLHIARQAEFKQIGWARLRLLSLRDLGRYLMLNGRSRGRPAKMSDTNNIPTLAALGIHDRNISVTAKAVACVPQRLFGAYLAEETEPTLAGLFAYAEQMTSSAGSPFGSNVVSAHYMLTNPHWYRRLDAEFHFTFDPCPNPRPDFDGLTCAWGLSNWVNMPFENVSAWVGKALEERAVGKMSVLVLPLHLMGTIARLDVAGAEIRYAGIPDWLSIEDGSTSPEPPEKRQPCLLAILRPPGQAAEPRPQDRLRA
jgi:hypothetical protein